MPTAAENGGMPELRSRARDTDFSLIDLPRTEPIDDPPAYLRAAVRWHFSPETGSRYWLTRAKALDFNPLTDVKTFEDLALFPNIVDELRDVDVVDSNGGPVARQHCHAAVRSLA